MADDPVDAAGECERVLWLERRHERRAEGLHDLSLRRVRLPAGLAKPGGRPASPSAHAANASMPTIIAAVSRRRCPTTSGVSGRNQCVRITRPTARARRRPSRAQAVTGMVTSQENPIRRTMYQCTYAGAHAQRRCPRARSATTCVVETGAPSSEAPRSRPPSGSHWPGPRWAESDRCAAPTVRMIFHPPSEVPNVSATAEARTAQVGAVRLWISPAARSNATITPPTSVRRWPRD